MKTAIVTFIRAYNFGAVLQCFALQEAMRYAGIDTEVLDYYPEYFYRYYRLLDSANKGTVARISRSIIRSLTKGIIRRRIKGFESFINDYIHLSEHQYRTGNEIEMNPPDYGAYVVGSDQVWNQGLTGFDRVFFLGNKAMSGKKKYSYAASFGDGDIPEQLKEQYSKLLCGWNGYSVREQKGARLLNQLIGEKVVVSCDPTLLLTADKWQLLAHSTKQRRPFIFVYNVKNGELDSLLQSAEVLRKKTGFDVIVIPSAAHGKQLLGIKARLKGFKYLSAVGPEVFLSCFRDARYVISDSFHGTVFSLLFHKQFYTSLSFSDGKCNTRAKGLLKQVELIGGNDSIEDIDREINWDVVDQNVEEMRKEGFAYIQTIASQVNS